MVHCDRIKTRHDGIMDRQMAINDAAISRMDGIIEQVEFYMHLCYNEKRALSKEQKVHLEQLRKEITVFGKIGSLWADECYDMLNI